MELLALLGRVVASLVVVLVLLWLAARGLRKNQRRTMRGVEVDVLARQPLSQRSSLAVVQVGDRALVLGVTESRVELLTETSLSSLLPAARTPEPDDGTPGHVVADSRVTAVSQVAGGHRGALAGSALSPATWSKALDAVREMTVRR
jgi:flagellar protein FliO/FliZ